MASLQSDSGAMRNSPGETSGEEPNLFKLIKDLSGNMRPMRELQGESLRRIIRVEHNLGETIKTLVGQVSHLESSQNSQGRCQKKRTKE